MSRAGGSTSSMNLYKVPIVCQACGLEEKTDMKLRSCSLCNHAKYCGRECQKKHWPAHKIQCKQAADMRKTIQEETGDEGALIFTRHQKWIEQCQAHFTTLMATLLDKKNDTHVIILQTERLDKKPYMRVQSYKVESLDDKAQENPSLHS